MKSLTKSHCFIVYHTSTKSFSFLPYVYYLVYHAARLQAHVAWYVVPLSHCIHTHTLCWPGCTLSLPSLLMKWRFENRISKQMEAIKKVSTIWTGVTTYSVNSPKTVYIWVVLNLIWTCPRNTHVKILTRCLPSCTRVGVARFLWAVYSLYLARCTCLKPSLQHACSKKSLMSLYTQRYLILLWCLCVLGTIAVEHS